MPTLYQNGVLTISPLKGDFYQGALTGTVKLEGSRLLTLASLNNFDASLLLKDLIGDKSKLKFSGIGHMSVDVTSDLTKNVLQNLNGKGQFGFDNGVLKGIDIANMINSAYAVLKKTPLQSENSGQTDFGKMTGTFVIKNGIVQNNDLLLVAPQFTVNGQGMLDLPSLQINYHLKTLLNKANIEDKDSVLNLYGVAIPILITGSLQNPQIGLDGNEVAKLLAGVQVKKVEMRIKDKLKGKKASELLNNLFGH
jgi:AsmA protein